MAIKRHPGQALPITGAASGIGRATALAAAARGAELVLTDIDAEGLASAEREIVAAGGTVLQPARRRRRPRGGRRAGRARSTPRTARMDVVMNVAGVSAWGPIERLEHHHWQRMIDINLMGPIHVMECFVPADGRRPGAAGTSSTSPRRPGSSGCRGTRAYSASKFGLRGISEVLRFDLRRHGIGVSLVCPGAVKTPLVGTVEIVGVDRTSPRIAKLIARFERHAVSPEHVAAKILTGIEKNQYMVFTSRDIRVGYFFQRKLAFPYELAMRRLNDHLVSVAEKG